jgi:phage terminase large subunit-like protein
MGLRGPGAKPVFKQVDDEEPRTPSKQPWEKKGLSRAERVIRFIETLPITSGAHAGKQFKLRPWQKQIIYGVYATDKAGVRYVREALITIPRKNGKTGLTAALALCHLCGPEAIQRGQVYSAAADRSQAGLLYNEMKAIIDCVPWMRARIAEKDFEKILRDVKTGTIYKALSSEATTKHGFSASLWIYDELAQAVDRTLYDVLRTSTGAHLEPLGIVISTQNADPKHVMSELVDYGIQWKDGIVSDPSFFAAVYIAPKDADPWDERIWFACNPALGDFRSLEEMRSYAARARRVPKDEQAFRNLYLNQRVTAEARWIPLPEWTACKANFTAESLRGRRCFGALDLSGTGRRDFTALVLAFEIGETVQILPFFWALENGLLEAERRDRVPYMKWAKDGLLLGVPGRIFDYDFIAQKIAELSTQYDIAEIAVDPWNIDKMVASIDETGANVRFRKHGMQFHDMGPAILAAEDLILSRRLQHNGNEILAWHIDNVMVVPDANGNCKFDKRKATGRIDGAVCLAMVSDLVTAQVEESTYSVTVI